MGTYNMTTGSIQEVFFNDAWTAREELSVIILVCVSYKCGKFLGGSLLAKLEGVIPAG